MSRWFIIRCTSGQEAKAKIALARLGYTETWFPTVKIDRGSKRKGARYVTRAHVPGYLFVEAESVDCYAIHTHQGDIWMRVVTPNGEPYTVTDEQMAQMQQVPDRIKEIADAAEAAERAARALVEPRMGEAARITRGPLQGRSGLVTGISDDVVQIDLGTMVPIGVPRGDAERVAA